MMVLTEFPDEIEAHVVQIFDRLPLEKQPEYIAQTGCGDGTFLKQLYQSVQHHSRRGRQLETYPLTLIGIDLNPAALKKTAKTLQGLPYITLVGDINESQKLLTTLTTKLIDSEGLLLFQSQADSQISAESFFILAAGAGLIAKAPPQRYPKSSAGCHATLTHFEKRDYVIRHAEPRDLETLHQLESLCWPRKTGTSKQRIHARIKSYPQGQFVLERAGRVVGVIYSQRIESLDHLQGQTAARVHSLHTPFGEVVQLLAINIHPEFQNLSLGDQLLEFMLQRCSLMNGVKSVCGVTICKEYRSGESPPFAEYIHSRDEAGRIRDSVLSFHESHGATIERALAGYRPKDVGNEGFGVLIHYDIHRRERANFKTQRKTDGQASFSTSHSSIQEFIRTTIQKYLGKEAGQAFSLDRPLMEMGLDSADLLQLQAQILQKYPVELDSALFFQYNTPEKVIRYLEEKLSGERQELSLLNTASDSTKRVPKSRDIAIVGMACKLPGNIESPDELWKLLLRKGHGITELPRGRFEWPDAIDPQEKHHGINLGGFIQNIACFDAPFFRIAAREAEGMDPQQRILLELAWACLEEGGINPDSLKGSNTGVFIGASGADYTRLLSEERVDVEAHHGTGSSMAVLANRVSYFFDFSGPSLQIDTACSSSLVAVHTAIQSLFLQECSQALVGGIHLICHPANSIAYYKAGMLARDGRCKAFDQKANGYVRSEGAVMLLLKPLPQAISDRNLVHAVIKGSAINHGGLSGGLTVPNPLKQKELLENAWTNAGITPGSLGYIEAHGTGTPLGDPIEIRGIQEAFSEFDGPENPIRSRCGIGSLKNNLGHLEAAAGIAGLLKAVLCLKHQQLIAAPFFEKLNPEIQLADGPLYIVSKHQKWKATEQGARQAGVSSFGSGGANAHVVLEEYAQVRQKRKNQKGPYVFTLSAKNKKRLLAYTAAIVSWLNSKKAEAVSLADLAYTLQVGRASLDERLAMVVSGKKELLKKLKAFCKNQKPPKRTYQENIKDLSNDMKALRERKNAEQLIQDSVQQRDLVALAKMWTAGVALNWDSLYGETKPRRISLPTYCFAKESYWIPKTQTQETIKADHEDNVGSRRICFLKKQWQLVPVNPARKTGPAIAILATDETKELAAQLSRYFRKHEILYGDKAGTQRLIFKDEWKNYDGIIDLTGCGKEKVVSLEWLTWLQNLIEQGHRKGLMLLCVTKGLESYRNRDTNLSGASRAGLYRMLQSEYSHLRSRHMDADPSCDDEALAAEIAAEFLVDCDDPEVCYRKGKRYRSYLHEYQPEDNSVRTRKFPEDHVLWITGGTRGLGYLCAQHFVTHYGVKRLVLTGREDIPRREQRDSHKQQNASVARKIEAIEALEAQGVQVEVLSVSLKDEQAVAQSLRKIKKSLGPTGGIIHCAGVGGSESPAFIRKAIDEFSRVLAPKVAGLDALYKNFRHEPLQFFILFSSVSAISPTLAAGQSDYAMANAYMNYAAEAWSHACPIVSIQWPSWKETGMGEIKSLAYRQTGLLSHTNEEGLRLLDHILSAKLGPVILPAVINPKLWKPHALMKRTLHELSATRISPPPAMAVDSAETPDALVQLTQTWLIGLFSKELKIDPVNFELDTSFQDYGVDSIFIAQVVKQIDRELENVAIDPSTFIEHPTIRRLANYLTQTHSEALTVLLSAPSEKRQAPTQRDKIAVVGMACHFPDANSISEYWENLKSARDSIREVPKSRWDWNEYYDPHGQDGKSLSKWGAFLTGIEDFDPAYFSIPESLAPQIDPLQRQWLEVSAEALADAGYGKKDLWGKQVGVFAGARTGNFFSKLKTIGKNVLVGTGQNFITAHLAHIYNFKGPNMVIDTACSSSLTAVHLAAQSIQNNESEIALAGGVEILLDESLFLSLSIASILSPDGRCKTFDADADGIGLGEGCGVLVLKPLAKAIQDQDKIYGVIDASVINNDGSTMGVTTPNPDAQRELIEKALAAANINPETITYIEAHGTGTMIGDPIELKGITSIFGEHTTRKQFCGVGSVKSNIGHLLSAAGAASIIKVLLAISQRQLPPTLHCRTPNPRFNFEKSPLYPVSNLQEWKNETGVLRAGISSFGLGGNNAHIIVSNEGVPATQHASLEPKGERVTFNRKRYWPAELEASSYAINDEEKEFMKFFEIVEV